jgi:pimeloyl-ACP methyl ester carboxylesterase
MNRVEKFLKWAVIALPVIYIGIVSALYFGQRRMLYPIPQTQRTSPQAAEFPQAEEHILDTADGEKVIAWHVPPKPGRPVVVFFHGNGDILAWRVPRFRALTADGTGLVALSFRGYAGSTGTPTERGLLLDGAAAYAFAVERYPADRILLWGFSLGSGVAVALAAENPIGRLILEAPYTSTSDVAGAMLPFVPVSLLMKDQFRSDQRIANVTAPLLVLHGERDGAISIKLGEQLYALAPGPKRFVRFPEGGHENLDNFGAIDAVRAFLPTPRNEWKLRQPDQ